MNVGGFNLQAALPEADPVNFVSRVTIPVLMLNGRFDFVYPTETSQEPMFRALGTPAAHKRRVVYDVSHTIPRNEMLSEFVGWLEKYWGTSSAREIETGHGIRALHRARDFDPFEDILGLQVVHP